MKISDPSRIIQAPVKSGCVVPLPEAISDLSNLKEYLETAATQDSSVILGVKFPTVQNINIIAGKVNKVEWYLSNKLLISLIVNPGLAREALGKITNGKRLVNGVAFSLHNGCMLPGQSVTVKVSYKDNDFYNCYLYELQNLDIKDV